MQRESPTTAMSVMTNRQREGKTQTQLVLTLELCFIDVTNVTLLLHYCSIIVYMDVLLYIWRFNNCYIIVTWMLTYVINVINVTWMHVSLGVCFIDVTNVT